ncbi:hypothetical protein BC830DRAFT_1147325 [Chytriomyces sp. MP71]|nr:hypothetical protein BC830DRAFT_1147325 [Chytriomyces sp. MP71]
MNSGNVSFTIDLTVTTDDNESSSDSASDSDSDSEPRSKVSNQAKPSLYHRLSNDVSVLRLRHAVEPILIGRDGMPRPRLSLLARHFMWKRVNEWAFNPKGFLFEVVTPNLPPMKLTYLGQGQANVVPRVIKGAKKIAETFLLHVYGSLNPQLIAKEPDKAYQPFCIKKDVIVLDAINDPRGVTKLVRATSNISEGQIIGIYDGEYVMNCEEQAEHNVTCLTRLESQYKLCGSDGIGTERAHVVHAKILEAVGVKPITNVDVNGFIVHERRTRAGAVIASGTSAPRLLMKLKPFEKLVPCGLQMDGAKCRGLYEWASEINDYRNLWKQLPEGQDERENINCKIVEVMIAGWPVFFLLAVKPIPEGQEVLVDYGHDYWNVIGHLIRDDDIVSNLLKSLDDVMPHITRILEVMTETYIPLLETLENLYKRITLYFTPKFSQLPLDQRKVVETLRHKIHTTYMVLCAFLVSLHETNLKTRFSAELKAQAQHEWGCRQRVGSLSPARMVAIFFERQREAFDRWREAVLRLVQKTRYPTVDGFDIMNASELSDGDAFPKSVVPDNSGRDSATLQTTDVDLWNLLYTKPLFPEDGARLGYFRPTDGMPDPLAAGKKDGKKQVAVVPSLPQPSSSSVQEEAVHAGMIVIGDNVGTETVPLDEDMNSDAESDFSIVVNTLGDEEARPGYLLKIAPNTKATELLPISSTRVSAASSMRVSPSPTDFSVSSVPVAQLSAGREVPPPASLSHYTPVPLQLQNDDFLISQTQQLRPAIVTTLTGQAPTKLSTQHPPNIVHYNANSRDKDTFEIKCGNVTLMRRGGDSYFNVSRILALSNVVNPQQREIVLASECAAVGMYENILDGDHKGVWYVMV